MEVEAGPSGGMIDYEMNQEDGVPSPTTMDDAQMQMEYDAVAASSSAGPAEVDEDIQEYSEEVVMQEEDFPGQHSLREDEQHAAQHGSSEDQEQVMLDNQPSNVVEAVGEESHVSADATAEEDVAPGPWDLTKTKDVAVAEEVLDGHKSEEEDAVSHELQDGEGQLQGEDEEEAENEVGNEEWEEHTAQHDQEYQKEGVEQENEQEEEEKEEGHHQGDEGQDERRQEEEDDHFAAEGEGGGGSEAKEREGGGDETDHISAQVAEKDQPLTVSDDDAPNGELGQSNEDAYPIDSKEDVDQHPPSVRVTFNDQDFSVWTSHSGLVDAQVACPPLSIEKDVFHAPLEALFEAMRIKHALGDFLEDGTELVFHFVDLDMTVREDDYYARDVTLEDVHRLHLGLVGQEALLQVVVSEAPRFISRYNELAAQLVAHAEAEGSTTLADDVKQGDHNVQEEGEQTFVTTLEETDALRDGQGPSEKGEGGGESAIAGDGVDQGEEKAGSPKQGNEEGDGGDQAAWSDNGNGEEEDEEEIDEEGEEEEKERDEEEHMYGEEDEEEDAHEGDDDANAAEVPHRDSSAAAAEDEVNNAGEAEEQYVDYEEVVESDQPDRRAQDVQSEKSGAAEQNDQAEEVEEIVAAEEHGAANEDRIESLGPDSGSSQKRAYEEEEDNDDQDLPTSPSAIESKRARVE